MGEDLQPKFEKPNFTEEETAFTFDSDIPTQPYSESSLDEVVGGRTRRERFDESWSKWGWKFLAATGTVAVSYMGVRYFESHFNDDEKKD